MHIYSPKTTIARCRPLFPQGVLLSLVAIASNRKTGKEHMLSPFPVVQDTTLLWVFESSLGLRYKISPPNRSLCIGCTIRPFFCSESEGSFLKLHMADVGLHWYCQPYRGPAGPTAGALMNRKTSCRKRDGMGCCFEVAKRLLKLVRLLGSR